MMNPNPAFLSLLIKDGKPNIKGEINMVRIGVANKESAREVESKSRNGEITMKKMMIMKIMATIRLEKRRHIKAAKLLPKSLL